MSWPHCPGCHQRTRWRAFPPSLKGDDWWCDDCLRRRVQAAATGAPDPFGGLNTLNVEDTD